jgi:hypothetical protein
MAVRYRPMRSKDIPKFVEGVAAHPVLGPRYGRVIEHLPSAIHATLGRESLDARVFEEFQGSTTRFLGVGLAAPVSEKFLHELKTTPFFWLGPELVKRITSGDSPLLSDAAVRDANSTIGLNLVVWHVTLYPEDIRRPEVGNSMISCFECRWRGFRLREVMGQADCLEQLQGMRNAGALYFHPAENHYGSFPELTNLTFAGEPRNSGLTRDLAITQLGSWLGSLFEYASPQFCFTRSEQRLLCSAIGGGTDEEMSDELGISVFAVKKTWRVIYDRVATCMPGLIPSNEQAGAVIQDRGKQKKQRLLAYLREHAEELRPVSRKLLRHKAA